nr:MAG TPA: hypothetical protein [Caudoviricetes sp.]
MARCAHAILCPYNGATMATQWPRPCNGIIV